MSSVRALEQIAIALCVARRSSGDHYDDAWTSTPCRDCQEQAENLVASNALDELRRTMGSAVGEDAARILGTEWVRIFMQQIGEQRHAIAQEWIRTATHVFRLMLQRLERSPI